MLKENKGKIIVSSLLILLPVVVGFLLWDKLPASMATHWGADGNVDGWGGKAVAVTAPYFIILLVYWVCLFFTGKDPGNREQSKKAMNIIFWIIPMISIFSGCLIYSTALGWKLNPTGITLPLIGLMFIFIGNYLPKCKQNYTLGIKLTWTIQNEENWNKTHRFAGKVWVIGGFVFLISMFFPENLMGILITIGVLGLILIPMLYSYLLYRKQKENGTWQMNGIANEAKMKSWGTKIAPIITIPTIIFVAILLFTGDIHYEYGTDSFTIQASYWTDLTVKYEGIKSVAYRENLDAGSRTSGYGSFRLGMGSFENDEFGSYTRYCYESCDDAVVLEVGEKILVINGKGEDSTKQIYEQLTQKIAK